MLMFDLLLIQGEVSIFAGRFAARGVVRRDCCWYILVCPMSIERRPETSPDGHHEGIGRARHYNWDPGDFFGLDVSSMSPRAQVTTSLTVLVPVVVGTVVILAFLQSLWWLIFIFGWSFFPAFGLLVHGIAGLSEAGSATSSERVEKERELLGVLRRHKEITPPEAALETSLTVVEADAMLKELAKAGHLDVRVRGGGIFYALWDHDAEDARW